MRYGNLQPGETVLLHGTGGVSIFALQFAKINGAKVIITSSSDEKLRKARQLSADLTINYKTTPNWETIAREFTNGDGVDLILETVGGQNLQRSVNTIRMGGHISIVGLLDSFDSNINNLALLHQQATIKGMEVGGTENFEGMNRAIAANNLQPIIDRTFSVKQTQEAFNYLEQGKHFGKVAIAF